MRRPTALVLAVALAAACPALASRAADGLWKDLVVMDCAGGLHVLPGTAFETDVNLASFAAVSNGFAEGIADRAKVRLRRPCEGTAWFAL
jgi:hypothetical protein